MRFLGRIPFWGWYLFSVAYCYAIWNPWFSLWHILNGDHPTSLKSVLTILAMVIGSLYIVEGHRTMNGLGITLFVAFTGAIFWYAFDQGFRGFNSVHLWGQLVIAMFMTLAMQGGRMYRMLTGRVPVAADVDVHHGGHQ